MPRWLAGGGRGAQEAGTRRGGGGAWAPCRQSGRAFTLSVAEIKVNERRLVDDKAAAPSAAYMPSSLSVLLRNAQNNHIPTHVYF